MRKLQWRAVRCYAERRVLAIAMATANNTDATARSSISSGFMVTIRVHRDRASVKQRPPGMTRAQPKWRTDFRSLKRRSLRPDLPVSLPRLLKSVYFRLRRTGDPAVFSSHEHSSLTGDAKSPYPTRRRVSASPSLVRHASPQARASSTIRP